MQIVLKASKYSDLANEIVSSIECDIFYVMKHGLEIMKNVSEYHMIRKYQNRTVQTNPWHSKEEPQNTNCHKKSGRQFFLSFPPRLLQN